MGEVLDLKNLFSNIYSKDEVKINALMKEHINFEVGGPADILLIPSKVEQIIESIKICKENNIPYFVMGNGSNLLVKDGGIRGVVIKLTGLTNLEVNEEEIKADCGVMLKELSDKALENSLTGLEFACGIPGSVGGAVFMNAGAYNGEIKNVIKEAEVITSSGEIVTLSKDELELGYRTSKVMKDNSIVINATFKLEKGNKEEIKETIDDLTQKREEKQPLEYPSAGSTFKRPEGHFAAKLIDDSGLRGLTLRGAQVSEKHCGFVVNLGNAKAKDILDLMYIVKSTVKSKYGITLEEEVKILGED